MSTRPETERCYSVSDIIEKLGNENKIGKNQIWVAKNYSLKDLIEDLKEIDSSDDNWLPVWHRY